MGDKINYYPEKQAVEKIINDTVNATVLRLKMAGLMKDAKKNAFQKTEELLRNYEAFQHSDEAYTQKVVLKISEALEAIQDDNYFEIIPMIYFEGKTREDVAEYFDTTVTTISRNKTRLINKLKAYLFSTDFIYELFT